MDYKWIGAVLIIAGCGGCGFLLCLRDMNQIAALRDLIRVLEFTAWELQFQLTPLPEIFEKAGREVKGIVGEVFSMLAEAVRRQTQPDISTCMTLVLKQLPHMPPAAGRMLELLGCSLGKFDLEGQLQGLESVRRECMHELTILEEGKTQRMRAYQTLGLCGGAALAILLV